MTYNGRDGVDGVAALLLTFFPTLKKIKIKIEGKSENKSVKSVKCRQLKGLHIKGALLYNLRL